MAFRTSIKSQHKLLSTINKKEAERDGIKMKGNRGGKKLPESNTSGWKGPRECFQFLRQYSARRPVYTAVKRGVLSCLFIIRTHGWQLPVNKLCVYICMSVHVCACVCCSYCYLWKLMEVGYLIRTVRECRHILYREGGCFTHGKTQCGGEDMLSL